MIALHDRRGFSLLELLVAIAILAVVGTLMASTIRIQRNGATVALEDSRAQRTAARTLDVIASQLRSAAADDISLATDTAFGFQLPVADGTVCEAAITPVLHLAPLETALEGAGSRWRALPEADDMAFLLADDGAGSAGWRPARVAGAALRYDSSLCPSAPAGGPRLELQLDALPAGVREGTVIRVQRRERLVIYRAGDGSGQLGIRRCPADIALSCGTVQPAVGALLPPSTGSSHGGLSFAYFDSSGAPLPTVPGVPLTAADAKRIASVRIVVRVPRGSQAPPLSLEGWVALRSAR